MSSIHLAAMKRLNEVLQKYRKIYLKVIDPSKKILPRNAIKAMCYSCLGGEGSVGKTLKQEAEQCTSKACTLYLIRPRAKRYLPTPTMVSEA
jgi:hypothetical protein